MAKGVTPTLLIIALAVVITGCTPRSQREVVRISAVSDPASLTLKPGYNDYVRRTRLAGGTEAGIITCRDGSSARYWFRSHHLASEEGIQSYFMRENGSTLFRFSDGTEHFMSGWFCCEVQLPEKQLTSLTELRSFIEEHHGVGP